ncbi:MAG: sigma-54 dependent transcriptional regulator [Bacteroidetes bacterium]|nr:sigma-54 dependent transcriptional regulator [Bacteroidota bacterium]
MNKEKINILLIEDEEFDVRRVKNTLKFFADQIIIKEVVADGNKALDILTKRRNEFDLIIMDFQIAGALRGEELIKKIKEIDYSYQIIVITKLTINLTDFDFAKGLMEAGAFWYCTKYPGDIEDFIYQPTDFTMSIFNGFEKRKLFKQNARSNRKIEKNIEEILQRKTIIGVSSDIQILNQTIEKLGQNDLSILISGPSGSGKELVANNIHYRGKRKFENFVPINCGSIPHDLIESEFFGYEKGSFTGANTSKAGLFELAHNGTVFLDEVGELPLNAQVKLLRFIQEGEIEKIGRTERKRVNVRVIAATNKNLEKEVLEKRFREDLFYRLNVVPVFITPLHQRDVDIPILTDHFIDEFSLDMGITKPEVEESAISLLKKYEWHGNVRELKNVIQRLLFYSSGKISKEDVENVLGMNKTLHERKYSFDLLFGGEIRPLKEVEKTFREKYINYVRNKSDSDAEAAKKIGLAPPNFHRMCKELGLK